MSEAEQQVEETYAKFVTNHTEMNEVLSKLRMRGTDTDGQTISLVEDAILQFEGDSVKAKAFDPMKSVWVDLSVSFDNIRREGSFVIGDISEFLKYLKRFGDRTVVEQGVPEGENTVHLMFNDEERKSGGYPAQDEEHINSVQDVEQLPFEFDPENDAEPSAPMKGVHLDTWFTCNVTEVKDILEDGDTTQVRTYPITADDGHIRVRVGDDSGYIETDFSADAGEGTAASVYGYGMDNVFGNLAGEVTVYLTDDQAMWVHQDNENLTVDYMIANDE